MLLPLIAIVAGLALLVWSADRFIDGAAAIARLAGMSPLLIGMLIVGFGTSAPEMVVSAIAALDGNPALAVGNAIGSNIANIGLILGVTALLAPMVVNSAVVRRELPILVAITVASGAVFFDGAISRAEAGTLLAGFSAFIVWSVVTSRSATSDALATETEIELAVAPLSAGKAWLWLLVGLVLLIASSRILVWGAVEIASALGVSDLVIGLTIVAIGTSLPELAASIIATRKNEHDIALGNVVGSNMFNLMAVIGIAGSIAPIERLDALVFMRDWPVMLGLTLMLYAMAYGFFGKGWLRRFEGGVLLACYIGYLGWLLVTLA